MNTDTHLKRLRIQGLACWQSLPLIMNTPQPLTINALYIKTIYRHIYIYIERDRYIYIYICSSIYTYIYIRGKIIVKGLGKFIHWGKGLTRHSHAFGFWASWQLGSELDKSQRGEQSSGPQRPHKQRI